jgi:hypothetical protein
VASTLQSRLQLSLVHLRTPLDVEALGLHVELFLRPFLTNGHGESSFSSVVYRLPGERKDKHVEERVFIPALRLSTQRCDGGEIDPRGQPVLMQQTATSGFEPLYLSFGHLQG